LVADGRLSEADEQRRKAASSGLTAAGPATQ